MAAVLNAQGDIIDINRTAMDYVPADIDSVIGQPLWENALWGDDKILRNQIKRWVSRATDGEYVPFETEMRTSDGSKTISGVMRPVTDPEGEVTEVIVSNQSNGTQHKHDRVLRKMYEIIANQNLGFEDQVEQLLNLGRENLGTAFGALSNIDDGDYFIQVADGEGNTVEAGDQFDLSDTTCEIVASQEETVVANAIDRGGKSERAKKNFGMGCYIGAPVHANGEVSGTLCFYDDTPRDSEFTEWEEALVDLMSRWVSYEIERREANRELRRQNEKLSQVTSILSHDLRNPLTVVKGSIDLAEETGDISELERAKRSVRRMEELVGDVLLLARAEKELGEKEATDLRQVASESWASVPTGKAELNIQSRKTIAADKSRLQQFLENLMRNAVEHSNGHVTVTVGELTDGFFIEDDGGGIPKDDREKVFDDGYSTDGGSGLGLMIVETIAEAHGWDITAGEGEVGGARFEVTGVSTLE